MATHIEISRHIMLINFASSMLRKILSLSIMLWVFADLISSIPTEEYAIYPVMQAAMLFFPLATTVFMSGLRRYVTEAYARGDEARVTQLVSTLFPPLSALSGSLFLIGMLMTWKVVILLDIPLYLEADARIMLALLTSMAALRILVAPFSIGFNLRQKFLALNLIGLACEVLKILMILTLLHFEKRVLWVVVATVIANLVELVIIVFWSMRMAPALRARPGLFHRASLRPMFSFGGWSLLNQVGFLIRDAADPLILTHLATPTDVAAFHLGSMPDNHSRRIYLEAFGTLQPALTAMEATHKQAMLKRAYFRLCRYAMWMMCFLAGAIFVLREEALDLYVPSKSVELAAAASVAAILLARALVIFPNSVIGMLAVAKAEIRRVAIRASCMSFINLGLTFYLVGGRGMGAVGSALSTLIVTAIGAPLLMWPLGLRMTQSKLPEWLLKSFVPGCLPLILGMPVWYAGREWLPSDSWLQLGGTFALGSLAYALGVWIAARQEDREEMRKLMFKIRARWAKVGTSP